jgi:hypothetical protein
LFLVDGGKALLGGARKWVKNWRQKNWKL